MTITEDRNFQHQDHSITKIQQELQAQYDKKKQQEAKRHERKTESKGQKTQARKDRQNPN
jgi:hypothetical protein